MHIYLKTSVYAVFDGKKNEKERSINFHFFAMFLCVCVSIGKLRRRQFYSQPLENGRILQQGSTFTYQDVLDELLVYTPDGRGSGTDEIQFSVTDGIYTEMGRLEFSMDIRKREGPRVTINRGLQISAGQDTLHYSILAHIPSRLLID